MATNVNKLMCKYLDLHKLPKNKCEETCNVVKYIRKVEGSKSLNEKKGSMVIISANGMMTGGRVFSFISQRAKN